MAARLSSETPRQMYKTWDEIIYGGTNILHGLQSDNHFVNYCTTIQVYRNHQIQLQILVYSLYHPYTRVGQNNGNTTDTVHTVEPPFAFNTATILLGMDSYKF
jgi:hypothetical protein